MKLSSSNRNIRKKIAPRMGDTEVINGFFNSPFWRLVRRKPIAAIVFLIRQMFKAHAATMAYLFTTVKATTPGLLMSGILLTAAGATLILLYNSIHVWGFFETLFSFSLPDLSVWKTHWDWEKVYQFTFEDVNSHFLVGFNICFICVSLFHTLRNWFGFGPEKSTHRGTSYFYLLCKKLFSKYVTVGEFFINLIETAGAIALGVYLIRSGFDAYFGYFLIGIASHEMIILIKEKSVQLHNQPFLD